MSEPAAMVLTMWGIITGVGSVVWSISSNRRRQRIAELQADMQAKLLERLSNSQELADFLKSESGQRLLEPQVEAPASPFRRILFSVQAGLVGTLLGGGILMIRPALGNAPQDEMLVLGTMLLMVGLGFLLSAVASFILSRAWGLINGQSQGSR